LNIPPYKGGAAELLDEVVTEVCGERAVEVLEKVVTEVAVGIIAESFTT